jgi:hypothetical protein
VSTAQPKATPRDVTLELLALQLDHVQQTLDTRLDRVEARQDKQDELLRLLEGDRMRAWTVVGVVGVFGLSGAAAMLKWLITT